MPLSKQRLAPLTGLTALTELHLPECPGKGDCLPRGPYLKRLQVVRGHCEAERAHERVVAGGERSMRDAAERLCSLHLWPPAAGHQRRGVCRRLPAAFGAGGCHRVACAGVPLGGPRVPPGSPAKGTGVVCVCCLPSHAGLGGGTGRVGLWPAGYQQQLSATGSSMQHSRSGMLGAEVEVSLAARGAGVREGCVAIRRGTLCRHALHRQPIRP